MDNIPTVTDHCRGKSNILIIVNITIIIEI